MIHSPILALWLLAKAQNYFRINKMHPCDVIVRTVVIPNETRAGVAEMDIQNEIQLNITISVVGT